MSRLSTCLLFSVLVVLHATPARAEAPEPRAVLAHARDAIASMLGARPSGRGVMATGSVTRPSGQGKPDPSSLRARDGVRSWRACGVFVTLELDGRVRGCRGTLDPVTSSLGDEVARNAVAAATNDLRFPPLTRAQLAKVRISVTMVQGLEPIGRVESLRPEEGLVVRSGDRVGVVLPFEGRDPGVRLHWGLRKAGLRAGEPFDLYRMRAIRFAEGDLD